jgi:hypothetical protein
MNNSKLWYKIVMQNGRINPHDICTFSLLYQLPNCNLFTQHVLFILWRDTTSELWTPVQFPLHCYYCFTITRSVYILVYYYLLPLDTLNPLFTANRWDWQPHRKLGAKFLVVLCTGSTLLLVKSHAPAFSGAIVWSVVKLASITFWSLAFSYWFDKPWFHNWGKLTAVLLIPPLGVPNWVP